MWQVGSKDTTVNSEMLCECYLPRIFRYVHYWIKDTSAAEEITLRALKQSSVKLVRTDAKTDSTSVEIFKAARKCIQSHIRIDQAAESGLSHVEQEVISLKLQGELDNRGIAQILGLPESEIGCKLVQSLHKLSGC